LVLLGLGEIPDDQHFASLFQVGARAGRIARSMYATSVAIAPPHVTLHGRYGLAIDADEGALLLGFRFGHYKYTRHLTGHDYAGVASVALLVPPDSPLVEAEASVELLKYLDALGDGVEFARELVNDPPDVLNPAALVRAAQQIATAHGLKATILDDATLKERGFNLICAVGQGSATPPALIHLVYSPLGSEATRRIAYVGKGVTFDTGGYTLKSGEGMVSMHCDMGGAAAVLGAAVVLGALKPPDVELHFIVPAVENMVSERAYRPNDIIMGYGKKTVEIHSTDAEGRLILADALAYAQELEPDLVVDLATLTGACIVALGDHTAALFSDDEPLAAALLHASQEAGEELWRMPLNKKLESHLNTPFADMKNTGKRGSGGAISAALFLKRWIKEGTRWAHLDIAGPAYTSADSDSAAAGGTGFGVLTLVNLATREEL
jgi:leucyl aminopeptidase